MDSPTMSYSTTSDKGEIQPNQIGTIIVVNNSISRNRPTFKTSSPWRVSVQSCQPWGLARIDYLWTDIHRQKVRRITIIRYWQHPRSVWRLAYSENRRGALIGLRHIGLHQIGVNYQIVRPANQAAGRLHCHLHVYYTCIPWDPCTYSNTYNVPKAILP